MAMVEKFFDIMLRVFKNFGYMALGCSIVGFIEVGVVFGTVFAFSMSILIIVLYSREIKKKENTQVYAGRKFASLVLGRPLKSGELEEIDEMMDKLSGDIFWALCLTEEDKADLFVIKEHE
jgi:hypothetical protein